MPRNQNTPGAGALAAATSDLRQPSLAGGFGIVTRRLAVDGLCTIRVIVLQTAGSGPGSFFLRAYRGGLVAVGDVGAIFDDTAPIATIIGTPVTGLFLAIAGTQVSVGVNSGIPAAPVVALYDVRIMACG